MKRYDRSFHFRYCTSKTDQYAKSYLKFSLGGNQLAEHSLLSANSLYMSPTRKLNTQIEAWRENRYFHYAV